MKPCLSQTIHFQSNFIKPGASWLIWPAERTMKGENRWKEGKEGKEPAILWESKWCLHNGWIMLNLLSAQPVHLFALCRMRRRPQVGFIGFPTGFSSQKRSVEDVICQAAGAAKALVRQVCLFCWNLFQRQSDEDSKWEKIVGHWFQRYHSSKHSSHRCLWKTCIKMLSLVSFLILQSSLKAPATKSHVSVMCPLWDVVKVDYHSEAQKEAPAPVQMKYGTVARKALELLNWPWHWNTLKPIEARWNFPRQRLQSLHQRHDPARQVVVCRDEGFWIWLDLQGLGLHLSQDS